jgi:hypothetical protein
MTSLLCRNRVSDFSRWKTVFASHAQAHRDAGLHLKGLWRSIEEPDNVFFLFEVSDAVSARAFISSPAAAEVGRASGVLDGEYYFLEGPDGYGAS